MGQDNPGEQFEIPSTLYGRESELQSLEALYAQVAAGRSQTVLLTGPSGMGKSALLESLWQNRQRLPAEPALLAAGKFDPLLRQLPFYAFDQAITAVVRQILDGPPAALETWRSRLQEAVGAEGGALGAVVPAVLDLLGPQAPPAALGSQLLLRFVQTLAAEQPLVLWLDDMQWADRGSLELLAQLDRASLNAPNNPHSGGILTVAAYHSDAVDRHHPLAHTLLQMTAARAQAGRPPLPNIQLEPLHQDAVVRLVCASTAASSQQALPLTERLLSKTAGNPLFVRHLLQALWRRQLLAYNRSSRQWEWDLQAVDRANLAAPASLGKLLSSTLRALGPNALRAVTAAACMGTEFEPQALASLLTEPVAVTVAALQPALQGGLLVAAGSGALLRFAHDRVQEAAYKLLDAAAAEQVHHRLGMAMWEAQGEAAPGRWLFKCLAHLNRAPEALSDGDLRIKVATLNLHAAVQANQCAVYNAAQTYLQHALALLPANAWESHHDLMRAIQIQQQYPQASAGLALD